MLSAVLSKTMNWGLSVNSGLHQRVCVTYVPHEWHYYETYQTDSEGRYVLWYFDFFHNPRCGNYKKKWVLVFLAIFIDLGVEEAPEMLFHRKWTEKCVTTVKNWWSWLMTMKFKEQEGKKNTHVGTKSTKTHMFSIIKSNAKKSETKNGRRCRTGWCRPTQRPMSASTAASEEGMMIGGVKVRMRRGNDGGQGRSREKRKRSRKSTWSKLKKHYFGSFWILELFLLF